MKKFDSYLKFLPIGFFLAVGFLFSYRLIANAQSYRYFDTTPVAQDDGETIFTRQVYCSSYSATITTAAVTQLTSTNTVKGTAYSYGPESFQNIQVRKRTFKNASTFDVYIGSNTSTLATLNGYDLMPSTWGFLAQYETHNASVFYCQQAGNATVSQSLIYVIEEYNSIP